ncbi:alpha-glucuronidase [Rhizomicrobium palustre]|uniref:Xylan alpha-1,2-glucuronidase n=1 Tax=Rhizomicrobium palustre TaxID=189966 RepID=A0A846MXW4_9PROT|nr:alpha-glucuronidase family glycosyl hydrolase [Rhizomicrobium palustre]NIK88444.1 alpha-glucuronidase [Rhizomicrobium palustre]
MKRAILAAVALAAVAGAAKAEDGYDLWLRYRPLEKAVIARDVPYASAIMAQGASPTILAAREELQRGLSGLLGKRVPLATALKSGTILIGTPKDLAIAKLALPLEKAGAEGYVIKTVGRTTVIAGNSDVGALHGAFAYLRLVQTRGMLNSLDIVSAPKIGLRMLNHWDNVDRTLERGYSGISIFNWWELPGHLDPQYKDYARANASLGLNGTVLTNPSGVSAATSLETAWIKKAAALAGVMRPYGIKVYLSVRFSAPMEVGGLKTADPLDPQVRQWWKDKADEIYTLIPDFGGFLVKANSEGQPGPQDYGRSHADGANMMAEALAPHHGIVLWRAFVYSPSPEDRVKQSYNEFKPLDGKFLPNVIVQSKNGPLDFQPREPFSPVFGGLPNTSTGMEFQITKEYLGFEIHLVYLAPLWQEVLRSDTFAKGEGSTVARVVDGSLFQRPLSSIAGASNIGTARNWSGSIFDQANWYAFGRLAWDPDLDSKTIAEEWLKQTFTADPKFVEPVTEMMLGSRETAVDYMTPLGLAHQMATSHHYGPGPWVDDAGRPDWNPVYYARADENGIGVDRTATGANAVSQYAAPVAKAFSDPKATPENLLLWFHHLPWSYAMPSGGNLWESLVHHYAHGVNKVAEMQTRWQAMKPFVDAERFQITADFLAMQKENAELWRDGSIAYFQSVSHLPLPDGVPAPAHPLSFYKSLKLPFAPGSPGRTASPFALTGK